MPFKSEAQRKYLWANEPEIARDWTDTYGSRIQKENGGNIRLQPHEPRDLLVGSVGGTGRPKYQPPGQPDVGRHYGYGAGEAGTSGGPDRGPAHLSHNEPGYVPVSRPIKAKLPPRVPDEHRGEGINRFLNKYISGRPNKLITQRSTAINTNRDLFDKLLAADLLEETGGVGAWDWKGKDPLESQATLDLLKDYGYQGGYHDVNDPRHPDYDPRGGGEGQGEQPWLYPPGGIADTGTGSSTVAGLGLGQGHFQVPLEYVYNQTRAADGGRIGLRRGTSGAPGGGDPGMTSDPSGRGQTFGGHRDNRGGDRHPPAPAWTPGAGAPQHIPTTPKPPITTGDGGGDGRNIDPYLRSGALNYGASKLLNLPFGAAGAGIGLLKNILSKDDEKDYWDQARGGDYDFSPIEGDVAFEPGTPKHQRLQNLHGQRKQAQELGVPFPNEKEYQDLIKEDAAQTDQPKTALVAQGGRIGYQEGNMVGGEMGGEMESAMMQSKEVISELYEALIAQGLSPEEAMKKIREILAAAQAEEPQAPMMGEEFPGQEFGRAPAAFGGLMDTYTGRRKYGLGSFFKSVKKKLKKLAGSKLGKIALMYAAGTYLGGTQAFGGSGYGSWGTSAPWKKFGAQLLDPMGKEGIANIGRKAMSYFQKPTPVKQITDTSQILPMKKPADLMKIAMETDTAQILGSQNAANVAGGAGLLKKAILPSMAATYFLTDKAPLDELDDTQSEWDEKKEKFDRYLASLDTGDSYRVPSQYTLAEGGRIGRQEGGLMDLGGMEKDYREDGGFVPLGGEEKADDVPARLSRNEFVFTADAVKNAGGGDIDRGAQVMENVMKNLEAGGKVSEESQGQGAEEMFEVSERLSEVV